MRRGTARRAAADDDGISLIEVMVALMALTIVSVAAASFFVSAVRTTSEQSLSQNANALATQALESVQATPVQQLLTGRTSTEVSTLVGDPQMAALLTEDVVSSGNYDPAASGTSADAVPVDTSQTLGGTTYRVRTAIDLCWLTTSTGLCTRAQPSGAVSVVRATALVTWGPSTCTRCQRSSSLLLDHQGNPVFRSSTSQPVIVTVTPTTVDAGASTTIALTGVDFANGMTLSTLVPAGNSFSGAVPTADGSQGAATWTGGTVPGDYVLQLLNPDGGRAEFPQVTVLPDAVDDCVAVSSSAAVTVAVRANDVPATNPLLQTSAIAITSGPGSGNGTASVDAQQRIVYTPPNGSPRTVMIGYTLTLTGTRAWVSTPAVLTVKVNGTCP